MPLTSYYKEIHKINTSNPNAKEHSYHTPLQNLWNTQYGKDFPILHEGSSEKGTPDFTISNKQEGTLGLEEAQKPNWTASFTKFLATYHTTQPEAVLAYIYAVLYAPSYRATYAEDLSYDYPRIPFTTDKAKFDVLADLGQKIIDLHLLKTAPSVRAGYPTDGDHRVDEVRWVEDKLFINSTQAFTNVPAEVWNYQIGGYQVLDKWLKSRKARNLTLDEINHFQQVCGIIVDTISLQQQIDVVSGVW